MTKHDTEDSLFFLSGEGDPYTTFVPIKTC